MPRGPPDILKKVLGMHAQVVTKPSLATSGQLTMVGVPESEGENTKQLVQGVLRDDLKMDSVAIQTAHRTGKAIPAGKDMPPTRHIILKLMSFEVR